MKSLLSWLVLGLGVALGAGVQAGDASTSADDPPEYRPPPRSAPDAERLSGGGSRSADRPAVELSVLAPQWSGRSASAQPTLCWYQSAAAEVPLELTVTESDAVRPLLSKRLPALAGVQCFSLSSAGIKLHAGSVYDWSVALVLDEDRRSADVLSQANFVVQAPARGEQAVLRTSEPAARVRAYAQAGYRYDALGEIERMLAAHPTDPLPRRLRAALSEQVGLNAAAAVDLDAVR